MTQDKFVEKLIGNVATSLVDIGGEVVLASDILMTNDYSIKDQIAAYQQLIDKFGEGSGEASALNASIYGLEDIMNTFRKYPEVID